LRRRHENVGRRLGFFYIVAGEDWNARRNLQPLQDRRSLLAIARGCNRQWNLFSREVR
jgi:hypothetical protein